MATPSKFANVARGTAALSAVALLMGAGFAPAIAAEVAPDPTVTVSADPTVAAETPAVVEVPAVTESPVVTEVPPAVIEAPAEDPSTNVGGTDTGTAIPGVDAPAAPPAAPPAPAPAPAPAPPADGAPTGPDAPAAVNPTVTTTISASSIDAGESTSAVLTTSGFNGETLTITASLYGPFVTAPAESAGPPLGARIVDTTKITTSDATAYPPAVVVNNPGFYVWYSTIAAGPNSEAYTPTFAAAGTVVQVMGAPVVTPPPVDPPVVTPPVDPAPPVDPVVPADPATPVTPADPAEPVAPAEPSAPATDVTVTPVDPAGAGAGAVAVTPVTPQVNEVAVTPVVAFDNCTEARAAGFENIPAGSTGYSANLDSDADGIGCEDNGQDSVVIIDGGFTSASTPASSPDNTLFLAGGATMVLFAMGLGAASLKRRVN